MTHSDTLDTTCAVRRCDECGCLYATPGTRSKPHDHALVEPVWIDSPEVPMAPVVSGEPSWWVVLLWVAVAAVALAVVLSMGGK